MKTMIATMLALTALTVQAYGLDDPMDRMNEPSLLDRYEAREREIDTGYGDSRGTQVVVPIPPSSRGTSYYGPVGPFGDQRISTPDMECLRAVTGGMNCFPR